MISGVDTADIEGDTELFSSGLIDSFALVTLMTFIETEGSFRINPAEVNLENLDTIDRILAFANSKIA